MGRRLGGVLAGLVVVLNSVGVATANTTCDPGRTIWSSYFFVAEENTLYTTLTGVAGNIRELYPFHDQWGTAGGGDVTSAWVLLAGGHPNELAQVGYNDYDENANGYPLRVHQVFDDTMVNGTVILHEDPYYPSVNATTYYEVKKDYVSGYGWRYMYYYNGILIQTVPVTWTDITAAQSATEMWQYASQMPGVSSDREYFSSLVKRTGYDYYGTVTWWALNANQRGYQGPPGVTMSDHFGLYDGGSMYNWYEWDKCV